MGWGFRGQDCDDADKGDACMENGKDISDGTVVVVYHDGRRLAWAGSYCLGYRVCAGCEGVYFVCAGGNGEGWRYPG